MKKFKSFVKDKKKKQPKYKSVTLGFINKHKKQKSNKKKINEKTQDNTETSQEFDSLSSHKKIEYSKTLQSHYHDILSHPDHMEHLRDYTGTGYYGFNKYLRGMASPLSKHMQMDKSISSAIQKSKTPHDMVLYSGIKEDMTKHKPDESTGMIHLTHKSYTSTSLSKQIAWSFADPVGDNTGHSHILKIHVPKNSHGVHLEKISRNHGEEEVLLHKNIKLDVHPEPISIEDNPDGLKSKTYTWHAKLVHDGIKETPHAKEYK